MSALHQLFFYRYRLNLVAEDPILLPPFKGSVIRGTFGAVLRNILCPFRSQECNECMIKDGCFYRTVMDSPFSQDHPHSRKYKNAPHPYVLIPPLTKEKLFNPGDVLPVEFVLIGEINDRLPYVVYTFVEMGRKGLGKNRGKFVLSSVEGLSFDGTKTQIYNHNTGALRPFHQPIHYNCFLNDPILPNLPEEIELMVSFETPVRLKINNRLSSKLPYQVLIKRLYERALLLAHLYCGAEMDEIKELEEPFDAVAITQDNLKWVDLTRFSSRQKTVMKLGGLVGDISYKGPIKKHVPLLKIGEHIHVGKSTTFGLGKYKIALKGLEGGTNGRKEPIPGAV